MTNLANLDRNAHQKLRINDARALSVFSNLNMCPVVPTEIARLVIEYPIAFAKNGDSGQYICVAVFGLDVGQNLYFRDGNWTSFTVPLNVGRQPFYVGVTENPAGGAGAKNLITCIDLENPGVSENEGEPLFDASAVETPYLRHKLAQLNELVDADERARDFTEKVASLGLIHAIQLDIKVAGSEPRKVGGLHSIDEKKLRELDAATLADLNSRGYLHAMYAMLSSLGHLSILARRSIAAAGSAST
jgi:SapC